MIMKYLYINTYMQPNWPFNHCNTSHNFILFKILSFTHCCYQLVFVLSGLSAIAAAVMSSTDSAILGSSSMFTHNVYKKMRPKVCSFIKCLNGIVCINLLAMKGVVSSLGEIWANINLLIFPRTDKLTTGWPTIAALI